MDCLQNVKYFTIFNDFVVQEQELVVREQGQGLVNWSPMILEDMDFLEDKDFLEDNKTGSKLNHHWDSQLEISLFIDIAYQIT